MARLAAEEGEDVSTKNSALDQARQQFYEVKAYRGSGDRCGLCVSHAMAVPVGKGSE